MNDKRSIFDWIVFTLIHVILIGGISYAGMQIYGSRLGVWVAASACVAGFVSMYLFAKIVPGETLMKVWLGLCVALNAGYLVHNGAQAMGIEAYNTAQVRKYEAGMAAAAGATTRAVARALGASAKDASQIEKAFGDSVAFWAALLAFLELASSIVIFSIASKRVAAALRAMNSEAPSRVTGFSRSNLSFAPAASDPKDQPPVNN